MVEVFGQLQAISSGGGDDDDDPYSVGYDCLFEYYIMKE